MRRIVCDGGRVGDGVPGSRPRCVAYGPGRRFDLGPRPEPTGASAIAGAARGVDTEWRETSTSNRCLNMHGSMQLHPDDRRNGL